MKRKKRLAILLAVIILMTALSGCAGEQVPPENESTYSIWINNGGSVFVYTFRDEETGVWYISSYHGGLTPRINSDGSLYVK